MIEIIYFVAIAFFISLQAFFAASEIGFISTSLLRLRHRKEKGDLRAAEVYKIMLQPERFLATVLVGINFSVVISTALLTSFLVRIGVANINFWVMLLFTPFIVIFAELVPKDIGRHFRDDFSCRTVKVFYLLEKIFIFISVSLEWTNHLLIKIFLRKARVRSLFVTREEIKSLLREVKRTGGIDKGEQEAIEEVFEFKSDRVREVCVPLSKTAAVDYTLPLEEIMRITRAAGFTRYPVFKEKRIIGYLNIYDIFYSPYENWHKFIRPMPVVDIDGNLYEVFSRMKLKKEAVAMVVHSGTVMGIVTLGDLMRAVTTSIIKI
jgi:putative hemolysin